MAAIQSIHSDTLSIQANKLFEPMNFQLDSEVEALRLQYDVGPIPEEGTLWAEGAGRIYSPGDGEGQAFAASGFPDEVTREGFWKYCQGLEANANGHHMTEDDLFFPFLRERMPDPDFDQLEVDHQAMHVHLAEMRAAREA